jgi:hypothetical protein
MTTRGGDTVPSIGAEFADLSDWGARHQRLVAFQQGTTFEVAVV